MNLFYLSSLKSLDQACEQSRITGDDIILSNNLFVYETAIKKNLNTCSLDRFIDIRTSEDIDKTAFYLSKHWYEKLSPSVFKYKEIDLGLCNHFNILMSIVFILKIHFALSAIFKNNDIEKVFSDYPPGSLNNQILSLFSDKIVQIDSNTKGYSLNNLINNPNQYYNYEIYGGKEKKNVSVRTICLYLLALVLSKIKHINQREYLLIIPSNQNNNLIEEFLRTQRNLYLMIPRSFLSLKLIKAFFLTGKIRLFDLSSNYSYKNTFTETPYKFNTEVPFDIHLELLNGIFSDLFTSALGIPFQQIRSMIDHFEQLFTLNNIKLIITPNDCTQSLRTLVLVAKKFYVSSVVVQHGHLGWFDDENHSLSKYSAVFSESTGTLLHKKYSIPQERIVIFDYFHKNN